jgi:protein-S-isoprenylcysteine O-methyltransferase Ste14
MTIAAAALVLYAIYLALAFGLRTVIQLRSTGSSGFHGIDGEIGSATWLAGVGFVVALVLGLAAPVLALLDIVGPIDALDSRGLHAAGVVLAITGTVATLLAQFAMGASWRIGVDPQERTVLVTSGPFALVRNPIFAAMLPTALGLVLMVPSVIAIVGLVALIASLELQVRIVEEPYLRTVHGQRYADYAGRVGRFLPGLGKLA